MINANKLLQDRLIVTKETISNKLTNSYYKPFSTRTASAHGLRPALWIYDELAQAVDLKMYSAMDLAQGFCDEPMGIVISTNSNRGIDPLGQLIENVRKLKDEGKGKNWLLRVYEPSDKDEARKNPFLLKWVKEANPSYGTVLKPEVVKQQMELAKTSKAALSEYFAYVLNMGLPDEDTLIDMEEWRACADDSIRIEDMEGRMCWVGIDISQSRALTSVAYWFPNDVDNFSKGGTMFTDNWIPRDNIVDLSASHNAPYADWQMTNAIRTCAGRTVDIDIVVERLASVSEFVEIAEIRRDSYRAIELENALTTAGVDAPVVEVKQSYLGIGEATAVFDRYVADGLLVHDNNPVTNMCVSYTSVMYSTGTTSPRIKPGRIRGHLPNDATIAMIEALANLDAAEIHRPATIINWGDVMNG